MDRRSLAAALLFAAVVGASAISCFTTGKNQWDFRIYYAAAQAFREGLNPYDTANLTRILKDRATPYNYPPVTLYLYLPYTLFTLTTAARLYLLVKIGAVGGLLMVWNRVFEFGRYFYVLLVMTPLACNGALLCDLRAGNISVFEQLSIWIGFYYYTRGRIVSFAAAIVFISLFKLVSIVFLGLLLTRMRSREILCLLLAGLAFVECLAINALAWPVYFAGFLHNMTGVSGADVGETNAATLLLIKNTTFWVGTKLAHPWPAFVPLAIYAVVIVVTLSFASMVFERLRAYPEKMGDAWRICLVCFLYVVLMPRMKNYSYLILVAPALFAILSRPLASGWALFCALLLIYTYRDPAVLGVGLMPFFEVETRYFPLLTAWVITGLFCRSFLREARDGAGTGTPPLLPAHAAPGAPGVAEDLPGDR